jgi:hypothetical protein
LFKQNHFDNVAHVNPVPTIEELSAMNVLDHTDAREEKPSASVVDIHIAKVFDFTANELSKVWRADRRNSLAV